jgi:hypothetical protein
MQGNAGLSDVTEIGSARFVSGGNDENGTFTLMVLAPGASRINLALPDGQRNEIHNLSANPFVGSWTGPDGMSHPIAYHNLISEPIWNCPLLAIGGLLSNPRSVTVYVGQETRNGQTVQHFSAYQLLPGASVDVLFQHLTQVDVYLDSATLLPSVMSFNIHPDTNAGIDLPVEIDFSDYRTVNGTQFPFHIQKYLNGSLFLDLQASSVVLNSGVSPSVFLVQ